MKKTILIVIILVVLAGASLAFINMQKSVPQQPVQPPVQATPTPTGVINSPVASGRYDNMELNLDIGKTSFVNGENINAVLILKNSGDKEVSIEYFPNTPFNIFLYDMNGTLLDTFGDERPASMIRPDVLDLKAGENFSRTISFSIKYPPGLYLVSGAFMGGMEATASQLGDIQSMEKKPLIKTERIQITIT